MVCNRGANVEELHFKNPKSPIYMNLTALSYLFMLYNWIPSMNIWLMSMAIVKMAQMAILAIMGTIVMTNGNFCIGIRGIQSKSTTKLGRDVIVMSIGPFIQTSSIYLSFYNQAICKNPDSLRPI